MRNVTMLIVILMMGVTNVNINVISTAYFAQMVYVINVNTVGI